MASAKEHLLKAIELQPDFVDARYQLALLYSREDDLPNAIGQLETLLQTKPDHTDALELLAKLHLQHAEFSEAKSNLESILANDPRNPDAHYQLGIAALETNQPHDAIYHFEKTLQQDPDYLDAYFQLGLLHDSPEDFAKARSYFETTIDYDPTHIAGHFRLGILLRHGNRYDQTGNLLHGGFDEEARKEFEATLRLNPKHAEAMAELGQIQAENKEKAQAIQTLSKALELNPARIDAWLTLAKLQPIEEAGKTLQQALEVHPQHPTLHIRTAQLALSRQSNLKAEKHFQLTIEHSLSQNTKLRQEANDLLAHNQFIQARKIEADIAKFNHHRAEAHYQLSLMAQTKEDTQQVRQHLDEGIIANPHHPGILHQLAIDESLNQNDELAIELLRKSVEIEIQNPEAHFLLATLLEKKGDIEMAQNHYLITLDLQPDHPEAKARIIPT